LSSARQGTSGTIEYVEKTMTTHDLDALCTFIIRAKAATYVGSGQKLLPCRLGSHDLQFFKSCWLTSTLIALVP
jgi:hypothetical protein